MKRATAIIILLCAALAAAAQTITVQVPSQVSLGENFRLAYTVNTQDVDKFRLGDVPAGLDVVSGPYTSSSSSIQFVNGHTTTSSSITYTYTLYAAKNGTYALPAATAEIKGKTVSSQTATVQVSGSAPQGGNRGAPRMHGSGSGDDLPAAGTPVRGSDLFIRVSASKQHVYEQEPVLLTYKVFSLVDLTQLSGKMPDLTGFHIQELPLPQQKSFKVEVIDGKQYRTVTWSQYVMYPQMTGALEVPSITFEGTVVQRNRNVDPFEAFFNGGAGYSEVHREVVAPAITIHVDPLPSRPAGFSGGVGQFTISVTADKKEVHAGEPVHIRVEVKGTGNLKLIKEPTFELPKDFDTYDPTTTDKTTLTASGLTGSMVYDYLVVPRNQGTYTIPSVDFIYFDLASNDYVTIPTDEIELHVLKGTGHGGSSSVADFTENDIHPLKTGNSTLRDVHHFLFGSTRYLCAILIPLVLFLVLVILFRQRARANANIVRMKGRKANKVATRRLKSAAKLMARGQQEAFYDEVLRALWGYVSDKLNIPVSQLSRDNIVDSFAANNIAETVVTSFVEALDECEYARYAPGEARTKMDVVYDKAATAITTIDEMLRPTKRKNISTPVLIALLLSVALPTLATTTTKQMADAEYAKGNYQEAIREYNEVLKEGVSADLYYNLGNAYFRTENIPLAILAYERARRLSPTDKDILFNLQFARSKTVDKLTPDAEAFFVTWGRAVVHAVAADTWTTLSIIFFLLLLLLLAAYLFAPKEWMIRGGFYGAVVCALLFVATTLLAWQQQRQIAHHDGAIITVPTVVVVKTPAADAPAEMTLHEGTRVDITDRSIDGWRGVRLSDGRAGWLRTTTIEEI